LANGDVVQGVGGDSGAALLQLGTQRGAAIKERTLQAKVMVAANFWSKVAGPRNRPEGGNQSVGGFPTNGGGILSMRSSGGNKGKKKKKKETVVVAEENSSSRIAEEEGDET